MPDSHDSEYAFCSGVMSSIWTPIDASRRIWDDAFRDRPQQLTAVRLPGTGHFPTMARGAAGEEAAPISPDYEAILLRWLRHLAPTV